MSEQSGGTVKPITPGKAIFKVMKQVLNLHIILQPELAELLPLDDSDGGDELDYRLRQLVERIEAFRAARPQSGREVPVQFADGVQMQDENPQSGRNARE